MGFADLSLVSVVEVDERGRFTIPRGMRVQADRALIIPMGGTYMVVPIPKAPLEFVMGETGPSAKAKAERRLSEEVRARAKRRQHDHRV